MGFPTRETEPKAGRRGLDIVKDGTRSIVVSSHLLGELQKVATHYGIIRHGKMIVEMTADELDASCRTYNEYDG